MQRDETSELEILKKENAELKQRLRLLQEEEDVPWPSSADQVVVSVKNSLYRVRSEVVGGVLTVGDANDKEASGLRIVSTSLQDRLVIGAKKIVRTVFNLDDVPKGLVGFNLLRFFEMAVYAIETGKVGLNEVDFNTYLNGLYDILERFGEALAKAETEEQILAALERVRLQLESLEAEGYLYESPEIVDSLLDFMVSMRRETLNSRKQDDVDQEVKFGELRELLQRVRARQEEEEVQVAAVLNKMEENEQMVRPILASLNEVSQNLEDVARFDGNIAALADLLIRFEALKDAYSELIPALKEENRKREEMDLLERQLIKYLLAREERDPVDKMEPVRGDGSSVLTLIRNTLSGEHRKWLGRFSDIESSMRGLQQHGVEEVNRALNRESMSLATKIQKLISEVRRVPNFFVEDRASLEGTVCYDVSEREYFQRGEVVSCDLKCSQSSDLRRDLIELARVKMGTGREQVIRILACQKHYRELQSYKDFQINEVVTVMDGKHGVHSVETVLRL